MTIQVVHTSSVELVRTNASDDMVAMAAWVSNFDTTEFAQRLQDRKRVKGLLNFLWRERHTSPFEHGSFTFLIQTPLFVAREFQRHRTFSYNEVSGRYRKMIPTFYVPENNRPVRQEGKIGNYTFVEDLDLMSEFAKDLALKSESDYEFYEKWIGRGCANEVSRMGLPLNMMTQFYATANPLNVMKFLNLRSTNNQALFEIREHVGKKMELAFKETMPLTYDVWRNE